MAGGIDSLSFGCHHLSLVGGGIFFVQKGGNFKMPKKKSTSANKKICIKCGEAKTIKQHFYMSKAISSQDGRMNICKECLNEMIDEEDVNSVKEVLREINVPFLEKYWFSARRSTQKTLGAYLRQVNSLAQTSNLTFLDSEEQTKYYNDYEIVDEDDYDEFQVTHEMTRFWGKKYKKEEYEFLENTYDEYTSMYESGTPAQRSIYKNIAKTQLSADKALENGDINAYDKLMRTLGNLMSDASITPKQDLGTDEDSMGVMGLWIERIEKTEPIPKCRDEFKDVDGIRKYVTEWFLKPMKKMIGRD